MLVRRLLAERDLRVLFTGQLLNMFGDTAMVIVLGIWVKTLTGSAGAAGTVFLLLAVSAILAPLTGLLVDRFPRRKVLIVNDLGSAALVALLFFVNGANDVWLVYVVALGYGFSGSVYRAARGGLVHSMVPGELLGDVNGLFSAFGQGMRIIGPLVGAALFAWAGGGAVALVDIVTFIVSAGSFWLLRDVPDIARGKQAAEAEAETSLLTDLAAGLRHVLGTPLLRRIVLASAVAFTAAATIDVAIFALIDEGLHRPATFLGLLGAVQGAGSIVAGLMVPTVLRKRGEYGTAGIGFLLNALGLGLSASATVPGAAAGAFAVGLGLPMVLVAEITLVQRTTARELQGRAISASDAIIDVPFAIAIAVAAGLIGVVGYRAIYVFDAVAFLLVGIVMVALRRLTDSSTKQQGDLTADVKVTEPGTTETVADGTVTEPVVTGHTLTDAALIDAALIDAGVPGPVDAADAVEPGDKP